MDEPWGHLPFERSAPAVDRAAIEAAAKRIGLPFPPEYVAFLVAHNGGAAGHWPRFPIEGCKRDAHGLLQVFYHVGPGPDVNELAQKYGVFRRRVPPGLLPIASDPGGNQVCLVCAGDRTGEVVFWERAFEANTDEGEQVGWGNVYRIAGSLDDFFRSLQQDDD